MQLRSVKVVGDDAAAIGPGGGFVGAGRLGGCRPPPRTTAEGPGLDPPGWVYESPYASLRTCARERDAILDWALNMCE